MCRVGGGSFYVIICLGSQGVNSSVNFSFINEGVGRAVLNEVQLASGEAYFLHGEELRKQLARWRQSSLLSREVILQYLLPKK